MTLSKTATALHAIMSNIDLFSELVLGIKLYPYQREPIHALLQSIFQQRGLEFLLVYSRQSGKNEAAAHLIVYLLNLLQRQNITIVYAATGDGLARGIRRLEERLNNDWNRQQWRSIAKPRSRKLNKAAVAFISSHPLAAARGETANPLLVIDELQDTDRNHIESVFTPMRAANNATALYMGTVRTSHDALWLKKNELEQQTKKDGIKRVYFANPNHVTASNPHYKKFLQHQETRMGKHHPIILSEYYLQPIDAAGGLFPQRRIQLMTGSHPRQLSPDGTTPVIALLDIGGQDEASTNVMEQLDNPARDYTTCTIVAVHLDPNHAYNYKALDIFTDHGSRHFQQTTSKPALSQQLLSYLQHWQIAHLISDATGIGESITDWLTQRLGTHLVTSFKFTKTSKAHLGSQFIALIETNRFHYWQTKTEYDDAYWFYLQAAHCTYELSPGAQFDTDLKWYVPTTARTHTPTGPAPIHDDRLISAALIAEADKLLKSGKIHLGVTQSVIIDAPNPLANLTF